MIAALYETSGRLVRYRARAMVDGSPAASLVFDELASGAEEFLSGMWPERFPPDSQKVRDAAAVMARCTVGPSCCTTTSRDGWASTRWIASTPTRIALAMFDIYASMGEYATSDAGDQIRDAVAGSVDRAAPSNEEHGNA